MSKFGTQLNRQASLAGLLLLPIALHAQTFVTSIPIGPQPSLVNPGQMIVNPANHKVYIAGDSGVVAVVDGATNRTLAHIRNTNGATYGMLLNPAANQIYLLGGNIQIIDSATDTIVNTFTPPPIAGAVTSGFGAPIYAEGGYNPATNRLYVMEAYEVDNRNLVQLVALDGGTGAQLAVVATSNATAPFLGASIVNPANNKIYGIASGGLSTVGGYEVYDGATNTRIAGTLFQSPQATNYMNGYLSSYQINPVDNSVWVTTWLQACELAADGHTVLCTPATTRFYRIDGATNQLTFQDAFGFFTGLGFDAASGRLIGSASCVPTTATDPPTLSATPCSALTTTMGMAVFDPAAPTKLIMLNPNLPPAGCSVLPRSSAGAFLGGGLLGMDLANGYFYYTDCMSPYSVFVTKGTFTGTPAATIPPSLNAIQSVGSFPTSASFQNANLAIDPSTHRAFIGNPGNYVSMFDPSVPALTTQLLGNRPASLTVNPATNAVYVGDAVSKTLNVIDGATNTERPQIYSGQGPYVAVNASTNQVVAAGPSALSGDPNQVHGAALLDGTSEAVLTQLQAAASTGIAVNSTTNVGYFVNGSQWYAVNLGTGARQFTGFDFAGGAGTTVCQFTGVAVNSAANSYYIAGSCAGGPGTLAVLDGTSNAVLAQTTLAAGRKVGRLALNPASNKIYWETDVVINPIVGPVPAINVYDGASLASVSSINGANFPIAFNTTRNLIYSTLAGDVSVYDGVTNLLVTRASAPVLHVGSIFPTPAIALNEPLHSVYVTDLVDGSVGAVNVFREPLYNLGGRVVNGSTGLAGVALTITGAAGTVNVVTDANGTFTMPNTVLPGSYTVTVSNPLTCGGKFTCAPVSQTITITNADVTTVNFSATPNFNITGVVVDALGNPLGGNATITLQGIPAAALPGVGPASVVATAPSDSFAFSFLPAGTYTITVTTTAGGLVYAPQSITVATADVTGLALKPITTVAVSSYKLSPYTMVGSGIVTIGTVTINQRAPAGGVPLALSSSDPKPAKFPATVTVPQGQTSVSFNVQGNGVSATTTVTLTASYQGPLALMPSSTSASLTVAPTDTLHVTKATWSTSTQVLTVTATSTNSQAIIAVLNANGNVPLGTMTNLGSGNYTFQTTITSISSVNIKSNLGGSTGQGVTVVP